MQAEHSLTARMFEGGAPCAKHIKFYQLIKLFLITKRSLKMTRAYESRKMARYRGDYFYFETSAEKIKMILRLKRGVPAFTVSLVSRSTMGDGRAKIKLER